MQLTRQRRTVRYALSYREGDAHLEEIWINGIGDLDRLKQSFRTVTPRWRHELCALLTAKQDFNRFAIGDPKADDKNQLPTLIGIHADVHFLSGGDLTTHIKPKPTPTNGNMAHVPSAGFDPLFFMWHA